MKDYQKLVLMGILAIFGLFCISMQLFTTLVYEKLLKITEYVNMNEGIKYANDNKIVCYRTECSDGTLSAEYIIGNKYIMFQLLTHSVDPVGMGILDKESAGYGIFIFNKNLCRINMGLNNNKEYSEISDYTY